MTTTAPEPTTAEALRADAEGDEGGLVIETRV